MTEQIKRYAEIKTQIKQLEAELEALKPSVFGYVMAQDKEQLETDSGVFKITQGRKKWTYSEGLTSKEVEFKEAIKHAKKKEELSGVAQLEVAPAQLVFITKIGE